MIDEPSGLTAQGLAECFFEALDEINTPKPTAAATPAPAAIVVPSMPLCTGSGWPLTYDGGFVFGSRIDDVEIFDVENVAGHTGEAFELGIGRHKRRAVAVSFIESSSGIGRQSVERAACVALSPRLLFSVAEQRGTNSLATELGHNVNL